MRRAASRTGTLAMINRTVGMRVLWLAAAVYIFLWVPDLDLVFLDFLHHRSIITHSVLPALVLLRMDPRTRAAPMAGALVGIGVHLSCDLLSPMIGYGQIWLPEPFQIPLGSLSYLWLGGNAILAFVWARRLSREAFPPRIAPGVFAGAGGVTAVGYGLFNEASIMAVLVTLAVFLSSYGRSVSRFLALLGPRRR